MRLASNLPLEELRIRAGKVFILQENKQVWDVIHDTTLNKTQIIIEETYSNGNSIIFKYEPNMQQRPEALAYLLGKRKDFND